MGLKDEGSGLRRIRNRESGFSRAEAMALLFSAAALLAVAGPQLSEAEHRAKQKQTIHDIKSMATAMMSFATDFGGFPAVQHSGDPAKTWPPMKTKDGEAAIVPDLIQTVPAKDGWGTPYGFLAGPPSSVPYTFMKEGVSQHFCLYSLGADGQPGSPEPEAAKGPEAAKLWCSPNSTTGRVLLRSHCFSTDIIWEDNAFVQAPDGPQKGC